MKKIITFFIVALTNAMILTASTKDNQAAVSMVAYEQSWKDNSGTIALKNNTTNNIQSVTFMIEYLDMQNTPMDYKTYSYDIDIAPGMTKKINIPAYERNRHYHYYKTKDEFGHPAFKIRYELKDYTSSSTQAGTDNSEAKLKTYSSDDFYDDYLTDIDYKGDHTTNNNKSNAIPSLIMLICMIVMLGIYVGMYVLVAEMAKKRNRNPALWIIASFVGTPIIVCIVLLVLGPNYNRY